MKPQTEDIISRALFCFFATGLTVLGAGLVLTFWTIPMEEEQYEVLELPVLEKETRQITSGVIFVDTFTRYVLVFDLGWQGIIECHIDRQLYFKVGPGACVQFTHDGFGHCKTRRYPPREVAPPCDPKPIVQPA